MGINIHSQIILELYFECGREVWLQLKNCLLYYLLIFYFVHVCAFISVCHSLNVYVPMHGYVRPCK